MLTLPMLHCLMSLLNRLSATAAMKTIVCAILTLLSLLAAKADEFDSARLTGNVTDESGKPVAGATVRWNTVSGAKVDMSKPFGTTTDKDGRYELGLWFEKGKTLTVKDVFAEMEGCVRAAPPANIPLSSGDSVKLDFRLQRGEVLAGTMRLPLFAYQRALPKAAQEAVSKRMIYVTGPKLEGLTDNARLYLTEPSGNFRIYLPRGEYSLSVLGYGTEHVEWKGIKAGQENLVLDLPPFEWSEAEVGRVFDELWSAMDGSYSYFFLKEDVDWQAVKEKYRPEAIQSSNPRELAAVLQEMLAVLRDMHIWIETPDGSLPTYRSSYTYNGDRHFTLAQLEERMECGKFAIVGRTKGDGFGYFLMVRQSEANPADVQKAVEAIGTMRDAPGFVVDLRSANGGSEPLAIEIARLFCDKDTVYALSKYRNGPGHEQFGKENERILPATPGAYTKPIVCLIGPGAVSSGEGFVKMMKCLPHVTTVGLPTRGASGNPRPFELSRTGVTVYYSRWVDVMPDGQTFEGIGIAPDVQVNPAATDNERDPTLNKGLELLRKKVENHRR